MFSLKLTHDEPKLVFLALVYHLGRPGSELDAQTMQPSERGLRDIKTKLGNDLERDEAIVELFDDAQYQRLLSAIFGSVNELRVFHMRDGTGSGVARFTETATTLFPALAAEPEAALDLAESMMMLHRRIERAVSRASPPPPEASKPASKGRWPFRR